MKNRLKKLVVKTDILKLLLVVTIISPFVLTIINATLSADDFSMTLFISGEKPLIIEAALVSFDFYKTFVGLTPYYYLQFILNPILLFDDITGYQVGVYLVVLFLIFISISHKYIESLCNYFFGLNNNIVFGIWCLVLFCILNSNTYYEIFYWYTGSTYLVGIILLMINQMLIILFLSKDISVKNLVISTMVGFIACWMYHLAVFSGVLYVVLLLKEKNKRNRIVSYIPLLGMMLGGVLSAFAPGNFVRRDSMTTSINFVNALLDALSNWYNIVIDVLLNPLTIAVVGTSIIISSMFSEKKTTKKDVIIYIIGAGISLFGFLYPVALGYGNESMPNRIIFCANVIVYVWIVIISLAIGSYIKANKTVLTNELKYMCIIVLWMIVFVKLGGENQNGESLFYESEAWFYTAMNVSNVYKESSYYRTILDNIQNGDSDITIYIDNSVKKTGILKDMGLNENPDNWENSVTSRALGKESIVVYY